MSSENKGMVSRRGLLAKSAAVTAMLASGAHGAGESRQKAEPATRRHCRDGEERLQTEDCRLKAAD